MTDYRTIDDEIASALRESRKQRGFSLQKMADYLDLHMTSYRRIERGEQRLKVDEALKMEALLQFGLYGIMHRWSEEFAKPPQTIEVSGRTYKLVN